MERQKAFMATNDYIRNSLLPFGVGVVTSFDEADAMRNSIRRVNLETRNEWLDITIPERNSFLNIDIPLEEHPKPIMENLFSHKALSLLFYSEGHRFFKELPGIIDGISEFSTETNTGEQEELNNFYDEKSQELRNLKSVYALVQFITEKARNKDLAITSSFLQFVGINGIIFSDDGAERALIFDARNRIEVTRFNSAIL